MNLDFDFYPIFINLKSFKKNIYIISNNDDNTCFIITQPKINYNHINQNHNDSNISHSNDINPFQYTWSWDCNFQLFYSGLVVFQICNFGNLQILFEKHWNKIDRQLDWNCLDLSRFNSSHHLKNTISNFLVVWCFRNLNKNNIHQIDHSNQVDRKKNTSNTTALGLCQYSGGPFITLRARYICSPNFSVGYNLSACIPYNHSETSDSYSIFCKCRLRHSKDVIWAWWYVYSTLSLIHKCFGNNFNCQFKFYAEDLEINDLEQTIQHIVTWNNKDFNLHINWYFPWKEYIFQTNEFHLFSLKNQTRNVNTLLSNEENKNLFDLSNHKQPSASQSIIILHVPSYLHQHYYLPSLRYLKSDFYTQSVLGRSCQYISGSYHSKVGQCFDSNSTLTIKYLISDGKHYPSEWCNTLKQSEFNKFICFQVFYTNSELKTLLPCKLSNSIHKTQNFQSNTSTSSEWIISELYKHSISNCLIFIHGAKCDYSLDPIKIITYACQYSNKLSSLFEWKEIKILNNGHNDDNNEMEVDKIEISSLSNFNEFKNLIFSFQQF